MAMTSNEFYRKFKDVLGLPENLVRFDIVGEAGGLIEIYCVVCTGEKKDDELLTETQKYKLVPLDD